MKTFTITGITGEKEIVQAENESDAIRDYFFSLNCEIEEGVTTEED